MLKISRGKWWKCERRGRDEPIYCLSTGESPCLLPSLGWAGAVRGHGRMEEPGDQQGEGKQVSGGCLKVPTRSKCKWCAFAARVPTRSKWRG